MNGRILQYDSAKDVGIIIGHEDDKQYSFSLSGWKDSVPPVVGKTVNFTTGNAGVAKEILLYDLGLREFVIKKNRIVAGLLAIFLGCIGMHKFYLGYVKVGLIYLLVNTLGLLVLWILAFLPNIVFGIFALIEGVIYLTRSDMQFYNTYVKNTKEWF